MYYCNSQDGCSAIEGAKTTLKQDAEAVAKLRQQTLKRATQDSPTRQQELMMRKTQQAALNKKGLLVFEAAPEDNADDQDDVNFNLENDWTAALVWYGMENEDVDMLVSGNIVPDAMRWCPVSKTITPRGLNPEAIASSDSGVLDYSLRKFSEEVQKIRAELNLPDQPPLHMPCANVDGDGLLTAAPMEILMVNIIKPGECKIPNQVQHVLHGDRSGVPVQTAIDQIFAHMSCICRYGLVYAGSYAELVRC